MGSNEKRDGYVIAYDSNRYCGGRDDNGDEINVNKLGEAVVFADRASALAMRRCGAVLSIAECEALKPESLGKVAFLAWNGWGDSAGDDSRWVHVANAVIEEHERRKR